MDVSAPRLIPTLTPPPAVSSPSAAPKPISGPSPGPSLPWHKQRRLWAAAAAAVVLVAGIANIFIQSSALMITLAVLIIGIFSAFILYDLKRVRDGEETNYVTATLGVYLSVYNVFQGLLALFGIGGSSD